MRLPEVERVYTRAREAVPAARGDPPALPGPLGLGRFILCGAKFSTARELGEQLLGLAQQEAQTRPCLLVAY